MKLKTILCTAGLLLAMITKGKTQTAQHDSIRVHIVQNENGILTNIDTVVAASQHAQLQAWLLSQGIDVPTAPTPPMTGDSIRVEVVKVITDDIQGDSSRQMVVRMMDDSIPGDGQKMKIILLPDQPGARPPLPPAPPNAPNPPVKMKMDVPPPDGQQGNDMKIIIIRDSAGVEKHQSTKTVIVNGSTKTPNPPASPSNEKKSPDEKDLIVYPNPSNGHITISIDMPGKGKTEIKVTDLNGKTVYAESLGETEGKISKEIDLSKNGKGMYNVEVRKGGSVVVERVVIQ